MARATDSPSDVFPTPGGPDKSENRPRAPRADRGDPALGLKLPHRQVLEDPLLHVLQTVVVLVEDPCRPR